jgi:hypothetical protein
MQISQAIAPSSLARPVQYRPGSATSPAMEELVPGDYWQTEQDLAAFPQPVLDLLSRHGTRVAILGEGQTLADTPGLRVMTEQEAAAEARQANSIVSAGLEQAWAGGIRDYQQLENAADGLTRQLRAAGIDNFLGLALNPFSLDDLAAARDVPADKVADWKASFAQLNAGLVRPDGQGMQVAPRGVVILPHTYHLGQPVPENRLRNASQVTSEYVERSLGLNRSDERMVLLHEKFLGAPASELGNYRLAIHEMGHALDYALEQLVNFPGFGALHRETVDALFAADHARVAQGAPEQSVFTSDRADDDVREYFAEAVEAYLTPEKHDGHDTFRASNSREGLAARNPELYSYIEKVMTTEFSATAKPEIPQRSYAPPGFPDPDLEIVRIS